MKTSNRYVVGNNTLPFNPVAFGEVMFLLVFRVLSRGIVKEEYLVITLGNFSYFSIKTCCGYSLEAPHQHR